MFRPVALALNCTSMVGNDPWLSLDAARRAGLLYLELTAGRHARAMVRHDMDKAELARILRRVKSHGLSVLALGAHRDLSDALQAAEFLKLLEAAAYLGCARVTTAAGDAASAERYAEPLLRASRRADELGIKLCIENHGRVYGSGSALTELLTDENLYICYDTGNAHFYAGVNPVDDLPLCVSRVAHVHIKDHRGAPGIWDFPALGSGETPLTEVFGLDGWTDDVTAAIELEFTPSGAAPDAVAGAITASAEYARGLIGR